MSDIENAKPAIEDPDKVAVTIADELSAAHGLAAAKEKSDAEKDDDEDDDDSDDDQYANSSNRSQRCSAIGHGISFPAL